MPGTSDVVRLIRESALGRHGTGIDDAELIRIEQMLGVTLPPGYRSFLRELGWLETGDIYVYGGGGDVPPELDVIALVATAREKGAPERLIPFARDTTETIFFLDSSHEGPYESPVFCGRLGTDGEPEYAAHDFASWLWMRLAASGDERSRPSRLAET